MGNFSDLQRRKDHGAHLRCVTFLKLPRPPNFLNLASTLNLSNVSVSYPENGLLTFPVVVLCVASGYKNKSRIMLTIDDYEDNTYDPLEFIEDTIWHHNATARTNVTKVGISDTLIRFCVHIFRNAQVISNRMVLQRRNNLLVQFSMPPHIVRSLWLWISGILAMKNHRNRSVGSADFY